MWSPTGENYVPNRVPLLVLHPVKNSNLTSPNNANKVICNSPSNCSDNSKKGAVSKRGGGISPRRGADNLTLGGFSPRHEPIITPRTVLFTPDSVGFNTSTPGEKGSPDFCVYSATPELKMTRESGISNISFDNEPKTATPSGIKGILKKNTLANRVNRYKKNPRKSNFTRKVQFEHRAEVFKVESYKEIYMQDDEEEEQSKSGLVTPRKENNGEVYVGPCPQCNII